MTTNNEPRIEDDGGETPPANLPATVQTVQNEPAQAEEKGVKRMPYVELQKDEAGQWHWCLFSGNGRPMCMNPTGFPRRNDAQMSWNNAKKIMEGKVRVIVEQSPGD